MASTPQSSTRTGQPPSEVTESTRNNAPASWVSFEISPKGVNAPVEVSACTIATSLGLRPLSASAICAGSIMWPHSASTFTTSAPQRAATSAMRVPKTPLIPTTTSSPGSMRLVKQNSMPALPVPLIGNVISFSVRNTCRSISLISSIIVTNDGSRCPTKDCPMASSTEGGTSLGPGPMSVRWGGVKACVVIEF